MAGPLLKTALLTGLILGLSGCGSGSTPSVIGKWSEVYDSSGKSTSNVLHFYKNGLVTQKNTLFNASEQGAWKTKGSHTLQLTIGNKVGNVTYTVTSRKLMVHAQDGSVQKYIRSG